MFLAASAAQAQITIGGSVFGGARQADVNGSSTVTVLDGNIFTVYGGNDISGTIGTSSELPDALTLKTENNITDDWNAFVRVSSKQHVETTGAEGGDPAGPRGNGQRYAAVFPGAAGSQPV